MRRDITSTYMYPSRSRMITGELKLLRRYMNPIMLVVLVLVCVGAPWLLNRTKETALPLNVMRMTALISVVLAGMTFPRLFISGRSEALFYFIGSAQLREIVLVKYAARLLFTIGIAFTTVLLAFAALQPSTAALFDALVYALTASSVLLSTGSLVAVYFPGDGPDRRPFFFLFCYSAALFAALIPFTVFAVLIGSYILCLAFASAAVTASYYLIVPVLTRELGAKKFEFAAQT